MNTRDKIANFAAAFGSRSYSIVELPVDFAQLQTLYETANPRLSNYFESVRRGATYRALKKLVG